MHEDKTPEAAIKISALALSKAIMYRSHEKISHDYLYTFSVAFFTQQKFVTRKLLPLVEKN